MSDRDLRSIERLYAGMAEGRMDAELDVYDEHIVYIAQWDPNGGPHYGLGALRRYARAFLAAWDDWRLEAKEIRGCGDTYVVRVHRSGFGKTSGVRLDDERFHVWTFRGGRAIRWEVFEREKDALEAAGVRTPKS